MNPQQNLPPQYPNQEYMRFEQEETIDLKKYFFMLLGNWYWFIIATFIGLGIAWLVNRYSKPVYQVRSSLIIQEDMGRGQLTGYENLIPGMEIFRTKKMVANEMEVLKSYSLAHRTLKNLDFDITYVGVGRSGLKENYMYSNAPFYVVLDTSKNNLIGQKVDVKLFSKAEYEVVFGEDKDASRTVKYGQPFNSDVFNFTLYLKDSSNFEPPGYDSYYFVINDLNALTNRYKSKLNIEVNDDRRGSVLFLSSSGLNAEQEANYLNKLMEVYILSGLEEKNQTAVNTVEFIDRQLNSLDDSLLLAEMELQDFRLNNNLVNISTEGEIIYNRLERYHQQKSMFEVQKRYYEYLIGYVNNKSTLNEIVAPSTLDISDPLLTNLIKQLNDLLLKKEELLYSVQPGNPKISMIKNKIENAREALVENVEGLINNNKASIQQVNQQLSEVERSLQKLPVTERQLISIQRQYKVNDQIYTYLLQKRAEAAIAKASNVADNKILDIARSSNAMRTSPNKKMNYMIGLFLGMGIPFGIIIVKDLINNKITDRSDIENKTSVPIIAHIGHSANGEIPVFENPKSALSESFRGLRTNLQYLMKDQVSKVITITSTISGEGKTFVALNLASIFALAGKKTLLVGLDLRKPKVHKVFNLSNEEGVSTFLVSKSTLDDVVKGTEISNLFIATSGPIPPNPAELMESEEMKKFIEKVRNEYDIIILDTPPFGIVTDPLIAGRLSDLSLFLIRQDYSSKEVISLLNEIKVRNELKNLGIVLNDLRLKGYYNRGYKYYNYNYTYKYGGGGYHE